MRGKRLSSESSFSITELFMSFIEGDRDEKALNTVGDNWVVDTCFASDTGYYETGILYEGFNNGNWIIVDEYESRKQSAIGHKKWIKHLKQNPEELTDIHIDETYYKLNQRE